jgi:hypothetical protein
LGRAAIFARPAGIGGLTWIRTFQPARVSTVDWELAGIGPGAIDLAALVVGKWTDAQRAALVAAYRTALPADHRWRRDLAALDRVVDCARLYLAVQWLGWSPDWTPPAEHAHDWLREAVEIAEQLEFRL